MRDLLRQVFFTALMTKSTQGKLFTMKGHVYTHTMDISAFISCAIPPHLERFLLAENKARKTDLSCAFFRMQKAIRGHGLSTSIQMTNLTISTPNGPTTLGYPPNEFARSAKTDTAHRATTLRLALKQKHTPMIFVTQLKRNWPDSTPPSSS